MEREQLKNLIRDLIREVLAEVLSPIVGNQPEPTEQWVPLTDAWRSMGYPSYDALYADVQAGLFRVGKEVRDRRKAGAKIARYQIDLVASKRRLKEDPSRRRTVG